MANANDQVMAIPDGYRMLQQGALSAVVREDLAEIPLEAWWRRPEPLAGVRGRGGIGALRLDDRPQLELVCRRYRRGGLLRHCLPDRFAGGLTRAAKELRVMAQLREVGVSVVEPMCATARATWCGAELRLVTARWAVTQTLMGLLDADVALGSAIRARAVRAAGVAVGAAFAAGLRHPDLHPDNLLARGDFASGAVEVALIDLDRASVRPWLSTAEQSGMLLRMARYPIRHADRLRFRLRAVDAWRFLAALGWTRADRRERWPGLQRDFRAMLQRHGLHGVPYR